MTQPWTTPADLKAQTSPKDETDKVNITWEHVPELTEQDKVNLIGGGIVLAAAVPLEMYYGFVTKKLWNWFVPGIFKGAPELTGGQAIGLGMVTTMLSPMPNVDLTDKKTVKETVTPVLFRAVHYTVLLGVGAFVNRRLRKAHN